MTTAAPQAIDWTTLRDQVPVTRRWAFFNFAGVAPLSLPARRAIDEWATDQLHNGDVNGSRWTRRIEEVRQLTARLMNASADEIAFVKNTSDGVGLVAEGFPWQPGDNVVSVAGEFPANVYPWVNLASRGVTLKTVPTPDGRVEIDRIGAAIDDRTRLVTISSVEYATGFRVDLDALSRVCRERGIYLFVDAIQGLGVLPLDVAATPIDFLAADGHKWLLAPEGAGIFYCRREHLDLLRPIGVGWNSVKGAANYGTIDFTLRDSARRWEGGSHNLPGIIGLGASLELLLAIGIDHIARRVLELTNYLCERVESAGAKVYSSRREAERSGIVSLELPGRDPGHVRWLCMQHGIVVSRRDGRLRVTPHFCNTHEELDRLVAVLASSS